jgi:hypothetical protein
MKHKKIDPAQPHDAVTLTVPTDQQNPSDATLPKVERFREKFYLAAIVAVLSFLGAVGGTLLSSRLDTYKWQRESSYSLRKEIFAKRMDLIERTIQCFNRLQTLDVYKSKGHYAFVEGEAAIREGKPAAHSLEPMVESVVKTKEAQAELSSSMTLDALYFGPKTKRAISDLQKELRDADPWWKAVEGAKSQAVLDALAAELYLDLT